MHELKPKDLKWTCPVGGFAFKTTASVKPLAGVMGQKQAMEALRTGIEIRQRGYNVFVSGMHASGRSTLINESLRRYMPDLPAPPDLVYVNNFQMPYRPRLLIFPAGEGGRFVQALEEMLDDLQKTAKAFVQHSESGNHTQLNVVRERFEKRQEKYRLKFEKELRGKGFMIFSGEGRPADLLYVHESKPVSLTEIEKLVHAGGLSMKLFREVRRNYQEKKRKLNSFIARTNRLQQEYFKEIEKVEQEQLREQLDRRIAELKKEFPYEGVADHLDELRDDVLDQHVLLRPPSPQDGGFDRSDKDRLRSFKANLLFSGEGIDAPPVVFENNPTVSALFGFIEKPSGEDGPIPSDFMDIRPGSLVEANRGFLVLDVSFLVQSPSLWKSLKTTIRTGKVVYQEPEGSSGAGTGLKPDPIPVDIKVILVGEPEVFDLLYEVDQEFRHSFKVSVKLEPDFPLTGNLLKKKLPAFVARITKKEKLLPLNRQAMAKLAEYGVRLSGQKKRFTGSLGKIADLLREANWCARRKRRKTVGREHITAAIEQGVQRINLLEKRLNKAILDDTIVIQTRGGRVGQVNGLAVYDLGDYSFGKPARITAETAVGKSGIINIERESGMSGTTHDKGVHILTGYLRARFAQKRPLSLSASLCFEQSYSTIDGDSASSSEVYALLSSLSKMPLRQDLAVTGSVNQKGEIQSIGCVNEKIEGFFDVIRARRPTGKEGVVIPRSNIQDLMLRDDVVEAVKKGRFHIWVVRTVEEGIEILTGRKAGKLQKNGAWTKGSVFEAVDAALEQMAATLKRYTS